MADLEEENRESSAAPLIRPLNDEEDEDSLENYELKEKDLLKPGIFIWALTFAAGISGLLFGYDTGVISSTLVSIGTDLSQRNLTTLDKSLITASTSLFALIASPITGVLGDKLGRKKVILIADGLFILGAVWQALSPTVWGMIIGRSIVGIAVGSASLVVPLYIGELSPSKFRGSLVTVNSMFITGGQVVAYIIGYLLSKSPGGWRWMVGIGAFPAALQFCTLAFLPETPRWLMKAGREVEARRVLEKVYGGGKSIQSIVQGVVKAIAQEIEEEDQIMKRHSSKPTNPSSRWQWVDKWKNRWIELVGIPGNKRALTIACLLQGLQQLCGFNSLMYFSATIFALVGFSSPTLTSLSIATTNFLFTLAAFILIDRIGRRRILLYSIPIMILGLALSSFSFSFITLPSMSGDDDTSPHHLLHLFLRRDTSKNEDDELKNSIFPSLILASLIVFVSSYALGLGNVPWQQSELFPLSVRSLGSGISTATNWGSNFVIGLTFLPMMEVLTPTGTFALYGVICFVGWWAVWWCYPETAGLGLEEVGGLLEHGWGVKESMRRWEDR